MMRKVSRKRAIQMAVALLIVAALAWAFWPSPVPVETAVVDRGSLQQVVEEEGMTRVKDLYVVSAPVAAYVRRITLEVGDSVAAGSPVAGLEPPRPNILDPRTDSQMEARVAAARAQLERAEAAARHASAELARVERLASGGAATPQALDAARVDASQATAVRDAARAELAAALAARDRSGSHDTLHVARVVRAPAAGRVLQLHQRSAGFVNAGEPLVDIGDPGKLEVAVRVLSRDAVRIHPGTRVILDQWGGDHPLEATVTRVEPVGETEVSALGVEEQRVTVLASITSPPAERSGLGAGYRVLARFIIWSAPDALRVPTSAVFTRGEGAAAFVVEDGRAVLRPVTLGARAGLSAEVVAGLREGDVVIVHPANDIEAGVRVAGSGVTSPP
ncbi:MAG TPA: efflux RND transporter periplasmic adaptor subunit, partial [Gemmatimonadaceae bacterium]|nr:efflux RND transporter periplasmic adaptor subunit [Gemmatimonadaceae bacterium]